MSENPKENADSEPSKLPGAWRDADTLQALIESLQDTDWYVRQRAAWSLGRMGDVHAVLPLIEALQDENKEVRDRAREALQYMDPEEMSLGPKVLLCDEMQTLQRLEILLAIVRIRKMLIYSAEIDSVENFCLQVLGEMPFSYLALGWQEALGYQDPEAEDQDSTKAEIYVRAQQRAEEVLAAYHNRKDAGMLLRAGSRDFAAEQGELLRGATGGPGTTPDSQLLQAASAPAEQNVPPQIIPKPRWWRRPLPKE